MPTLQQRTIDDFGEQWSRYRDSPGFYGDPTVLQEKFGPLIRLSDVKGRRVADIGSGTGRIVSMLLAAGAAHVIAVEPSTAAYHVMVENLKVHEERVTFLNECGDRLPPGSALDMVVSIGVIHHIPDPDPVLRAAWQALKPGGTFFMWVYGREGNTLYLAFLGTLRLFTTRLPHRMLVALTWVLYAMLRPYMCVARVVPLPLHQYLRSYLSRCDASIIRLAIYDQLNPAYAKYYRRDEVVALMTRCGFADVTTHHLDRYSWSVTGVRPGDASP